MGSRRVFTGEFKAAAVELKDRVGLAEAARELKISKGALYRWCRDEKQRTPEGTPTELAKKIRHLTKENRQLRIVNEALKKTTAILAKDSNNELFDPKKQALICQLKKPVACLI